MRMEKISYNCGAQTNFINLKEKNKDRKFSFIKVVLKFTAHERESYWNIFWLIFKSEGRKLVALTVEAIWNRVVFYIF